METDKRPIRLELAVGQLAVGTIIIQYNIVVNRCVTCGMCLIGNRIAQVYQLAFNLYFCIHFFSYRDTEIYGNVKIFYTLRRLV